jgi:hypothetical protein
MARIYARQIHAGKMTIEDVPTRWQEATVQAYKDLYNEDLPKTERSNA